MRGIQLSLGEREKQESGGKDGRVWGGPRESAGGLSGISQGKYPQELAVLEILQGSVSFDEMDLFDQNCSQTGVSYAKERWR